MTASIITLAASVVMATAIEEGKAAIRTRIAAARRVGITSPTDCLNDNSDRKDGKNDKENLHVCEVF